MWRIIKQTQRDYLDPSIKGENERPNPTMDVLREAIADALRFKPSEKTVQRVILAGSNGRLKKEFKRTKKKVQRVIRAGSNGRLKKQ